MGFIGFTVDPDYKDGNMVIVCVHDKVEFWVRASIVTKHR
jgi:hypothetical protein